MTHRERDPHPDPPAALADGATGHEVGPAARHHIDLLPDVHAPHQARSFTARVPGVDPRLRPGLALVVTELVTNAVKYGPGLPITVTVAVDAAGTVVGEVVDQGDRPGCVEPREPGVQGGFGLHIVERCTDAWGVYEGSTHVWFRLDAPADAAPSRADAEPGG